MNKTSLFNGKGRFGRNIARALMTLCACVTLAAPAVAEEVVHNGNSGGTITIGSGGGTTAFTNSVCPSTSGDNNTVHFQSGSLGGSAEYYSTYYSGSVLGGYGYGTAVASGSGGSGSASAGGNTVYMSRGSIHGDVFGSYLKGYTSAVSGDTVVFTGTASNNNIAVQNAHVHSIYGGYVELVSVDSGSHDHRAVAENNTITLYSGVIIGGDVYGGAYRYSPTGLVITSDSSKVSLRTNNTLNLWGFNGSINALDNFQYYDLLITNNILANGSDALVYTNLATNLDGSAVTNLNVEGGGKAFNVGDDVILISNTTGTYTPHDLLYGMKGAGLMYEFDVSKSGASLIAHINGEAVNPQTKAYSEARVAELAFLNQGGELLANAGMHQAYKAGRNGIGAFAAFGGGSSEYNTGSKVDIDGYSMITGMAWGGDTEIGHLTLGAFFEAGWGEYDTRNSGGTYGTLRMGSVDGSGDMDYYGGGLLARLDFLESEEGKFHVEASGRVGRMHSDFSSDDIQDFFGQTPDFDIDSTYYGAHLGLGYAWNVMDDAVLDLYGQYLWTHMTKEDIDAIDDPVHFPSIDSHRLRGGARFSYEVSPYFAPYIGAAYEHEFDGEGDATIYGRNIDTADLKGGTGVGELGITLTGGEDSGLSLDFAIQGYTGVRDGVNGTFQLKWLF